MASNGKRIIEDDMAQELILDNDSDAHISEDEIPPRGSGSEKEEILHTVGWQYTLSTLYIYNPQVYRGPQWDNKKRNIHYQPSLKSIECLHAVFFSSPHLKLFNCWWKRQAFYQRTAGLRAG
jgi:hypothetical protein